MPQWKPWLLTLLLLTFSSLVIAAPTDIPVPGKITMVDLGSHKCIPCKMMAPILSKLKQQYESQAAIIFIDVWEEKDMAGKFKVRAIPTQVFFDAQGQEVYRHQGFLSEEGILSQLEKMGVNIIEAD